MVALAHVDFVHKHSVSTGNVFKPNPKNKKALSTGNVLKRGKSKLLPPLKPGHLNGKLFFLYIYPSPTDYSNPLGFGLSRPLCVGAIHDLSIFHPSRRPFWSYCNLYTITKRAHNLGQLQSSNERANPIYFLYVPIPR